MNFIELPLSAEEEAGVAEGVRRAVAFAKQMSPGGVTDDDINEYASATVNFRFQLLMFERIIAALEIDKQVQAAIPAARAQAAAALSRSMADPENVPQMP